MKIYSRYQCFEINFTGQFRKLNHPVRVYRSFSTFVKNFASKVTLAFVLSDSYCLNVSEHEKSQNILCY